MDTQLKIQVHFLMLILTASVFTVGVALFIYDFLRRVPRTEMLSESDTARHEAMPGAADTARP